VRCFVVIGAVLSGLVLASSAVARQASQQVVLPGPVPYPTVSPPVTGNAALPRSYLAVRLRIDSSQRVLVGVDPSGRPARVHVRQRLLVAGKGDYQFAIGGPITDVAAAPGSESEPGLRVDQVLWAGFSPGRKELAADVTLRAAPVAGFLPVRLSVRRHGDRVMLTVVNATRARGTAYTGVARVAQLAALLDATRESSLSGARLKPAFATFAGPVRVRKESAEAPLHVEGELGVPGQQPVSFARTLGDGRPLRFRVEVRGGGTPRLRLRVSPAPVVRLLRPPGAATWAAASRKRRLPARFLLRRLFDSRLRLVRADQYESFLANPDANGRSRTVYVYETVDSPAPRVASVSGGGSGRNVLLVVLAVAGSLVLAAGGLVVWAHS
jgi:hypothetical protein